MLDIGIRTIYLCVLDQIKDFLEHFFGRIMDMPAVGIRTTYLRRLDEIKDLV